MRQYSIKLITRMSCICKFD